MGASASTRSSTSDSQERPSADTPEPREYYKTRKRYALLGLGRGVDITKPTPWLQKTSFQARSVSTENLVETDDGGFLQAYSEEVRSRVTLHGEVRASIKRPEASFNIGMHSEYTRSTLSAKHVIGTKVKNRTISFRVDFADVHEAPSHTSHTHAKSEKPLRRQEERSERPSESSLRRSEDSVMQDMKLSFEERLCRWLDRRNPSLPAEDRICSEVENDKIKEDIQQFIRQFGITHYVSAIELGGLEYRVVTEREYAVHAMGEAKASVSAPVYGGVETAAKLAKKDEWSKHTSELKQIGRITGKDNEKKVTLPDEAVIGCQLTPICSLVKNPHLKEALITAVNDYSQNMTKDKGPFRLTCGDERILYLMVEREPTTDRLHLAVTTDEDKAELFNVKVLDDSPSHHRFEFSITSQLTKLSPQISEGKNPKRTGLMAWEYYLETMVNPLTGRGCEPPRMRINTSSQRTRLLLKKRTDHTISSDTSQWRKGRQAYYISCIHWLRNGYLCVKESRPSRAGTKLSDEETDYEVCIEPSIDSGCDEHKVFMLFKLQPISHFVQ